MSISKGHLSAIGGVAKEELEVKMAQRKKKKPQIQLGSGIPGPEETLPIDNKIEPRDEINQVPEQKNEKQDKIEEKSVEIINLEPKEDTNQVPTQKTELEPIEEKTSLSIDDDSFDYMKKRKPKSETHIQITVRIPKELNTEIDKFASKMYKGWKQEFITAALTKEIQKIKSKITKKHN